MSIRRSHGGSRSSSAIRSRAGIGPAVDDHPAAATALDEDPVALPDVEDDDARDAVGPMDDDEREPDRRRDQCDDRELRDPRGSR